MSVPAILSDPSYPKLKDLLISHTGLYYYADKDEDLAARLARRMAAREVGNCAAYFRLLENDPSGASERTALIGELTIGETYFFRQIEHFELLRDTILPDLMTRNAHTYRLRIWSAGCATGAEPYSISLLLRREWAEALMGWDVSVLATDINVDFLAQARTGRFAEWALRDVPPSLKQCCFRKDGRFWFLNPEYREPVTFEYHNLASSDPYPGELGSPFDLIFCRNVMIYFSQERIRVLAGRFFHSLSPGGWLLVGHAEPNMEAFPQFELVAGSSVTAYRRPLESAAPLPASAWQAVTYQPVSCEPATYQPWILPADPLPKAPVAAASSAAAFAGTETNVVPDTVQHARALADAGKWDAAASVCRRLITADALDAPAHFTLGLVLHQIGPSGEAQDAFRRAIYLDRSFALAHYHLGVALGSVSNRALARRAFHNVLQLLESSPNDEIVFHGDGIHAGELRELAAMHLESLGQP